MQPIEFYQKHLDAVSRCFSFCIARLKNPLRGWVSLSYLLCRVVDTVEDVAWTDLSQKNKAFLQFENFLVDMPSREAVAAWAQTIPANAKPEELRLIQNFYLLLEDFHSLPETVRANLRRSILNMSRGMRHFSQKNSNGELRLRKLTEVNQYCFFVAGLVGELLTDLLQSCMPQQQLAEKTYLKAHHFGLFLQKINLLKDQKEDEREGRFLVHDRQEILASLKKDAAGAMEYLVSVPVEQKEYRLFCAWSLFLGLSSLPWIQKSFLLGIFSKIPRSLTESLIGGVEKMIDDNQALLRYFRELLPALSELKTHGGANAIPVWFSSLYEGQLSLEHCKEIGIA